MIIRSSLFELGIILLLARKPKLFQFSEPTSDSLSSICPLGFFLQNMTEQTTVRTLYSTTKIFNRLFYNILIRIMQFVIEKLGLRFFISNKTLHMVRF